VGSEVKVKKDVNITYDPGLANLVQNGGKLYDSVSGSYRECTGLPTGTTPGSGC
jgi:hypothetical protein